ncbi:MAG: dTDP-4-dehydrorhamnose 3,5-epimerase [Bacteroidota bacterium]
MDFKFTPLAIPEVKLVEHEIFKDERGFFIETFRQENFSRAGLPTFVQDNHSCSGANVVRGLHYQAEPMAVGKLVRCLRGRLFDAVVDIRKGSPTYGKYVSVELSEDDAKMLWVPPGFAHGILTLEDRTEIYYKVSNYYSPQHDRAIRWDDPAIGIQWPTRDVMVSAKDKAAPLLADVDNNFVYGA